MTTLPIVLLLASVVGSVHSRALLPTTTTTTTTTPALGYTFRPVHTWTVANAATTSVAPGFPGSDSSPALLITTFDSVGSDHIISIPDLADALKNKSKDPFTFATFDWPNQAEFLNKTVFNQDNLVLAVGGFLPPGKSTGSISLFDVSDLTHSQEHKISADKKGYFYHHAVTADMNGDGKMDILSARATDPTLPWKGAKGELVWFEQPTEGWKGTWKEHVLIEGPDVSFIFEDLDGDDKMELIATEFFSSNNLVLYWCDKDSWSECDSKSIQSRVIDSVDGPFFDIQYFDVNNDNVTDLLVTNNRADGKGSVFAYEIPKDIKKGNFTQHVLSTDYKPKRSILPGKGAPGRAIAFHPRPGHTHFKAFIVVSGDDQGTLSLLSPNNQNITDWGFHEEFLVNSTGTVGTPSLFDVDGDGSLELFAPLFHEGKVTMFKFANSTELDD